LQDYRREGKGVLSAEAGWRELQGEPILNKQDKRVVLHGGGSNAGADKLPAYADQPAPDKHSYQLEGGSDQPLLFGRVHSGITIALVASQETEHVQFEAA